MVTDQIGRFASDLPNIIQSLTQRFDELAPQWMKDAVAQSGTDVQGSVTQFAGKAADWILSVLKTVLSGGLALVNLVSLLVVTPIVAFYLLVDWDDMIATVDSWVPREHVETVRALGREVNVAMAGFIRGQGTVCLVLGFFYAVALSLRGAQVRPGHRASGRRAHLHSLCRGADRRRAGDRRGARPVLAGLLVDRAGGGDLRRGPVPGRQFPVAQAGGKERRACTLCG